MIPSRLLPVVVALAIPLSTVSCDSSSSDPDPFTQETFPLQCQPQSVRLVGTIDDMSIDVTLPASGGLSQDNNGGDYIYQGGTIPDPTQADLFLAWDRLTPQHVVVDAHGTFRMVEGPFAGETFCAGAGSRIRMPGNDTVLEFALAGLASGDGCTAARTGSIQGCVRF
ncbi:MAG TPA: hypothetical protein VIQ54_00590 [Polyangia bacterium]|jgi:hypothetical protein